MKRIVGALVFVLLSVGLASCSGDKDASPGDATASALKSTASSALLDYVPADTPYFFAALAPMQDDVREAMQAMNEEVLKSYGDLIRNSLAELEGEEGENAAAVAEKLASYFEDGRLDELGIGDEATGGLYGVGLLPVFRVSLDDTAQFDKGIAELETAAGEPMPTASIDGVEYRYVDSDDAKFIIASESDYAVASFLPSGASDEVLKQVLGIDKPAANLGGTDKISTLSSKHGMLPQGLGFLDVLAIAEVFLTEQSGVNAELLAMSDYDPADISDICKTEVREMAGVMPQIDFGYTLIEPGRMDILTVANIRTDLAKAMKGLAAPVPGLGGAMEGVMAFGFSVNLAAAREFIADRADAMAADPFECEYFADMQDSVAEMQAAVNQPLPPVVDSLRGIKFIVDSLDNIDVASGQPPQITGRALVAVDDAPSVMMMGQMFLPQLAELQLEPNGEAQELPPGLIPMSTDPAFVAMTNNALAFGIGADSGDGLGAMFSAPADSQPPIMSFSYDLAAYMQVMQDVINQAGAADDNGDVDTEALTDMFDALQKYFDRTWFDVRLTDDGVETVYAVTLK